MKKTTGELPNCSGCTRPDPFGSTHQEMTKQHPDTLANLIAQGKVVQEEIPVKPTDSWREEFDKRFPMNLEGQLGHEHTEDCEWVCNKRKHMTDFIQSLLDQAKEKTRKEIQKGITERMRKEKEFEIKQKVDQAKKEEREKVEEEVNKRLLAVLDNLPEGTEAVLKRKTDV